MTSLEKSFDVSRNPSDYEPTAHCRRRVDERVMVDYDIITEAIEDGDIKRVDEERVDDYEGSVRRTAKIEYDWCLSTFEVVVGVDDPKVVTAYEAES
jgi:hypothetical protein